MTLSRRQLLAAAAGLAASPTYVLSAGAEESGDGFRLLRARPAKLPLLGEGRDPTGIWSWDQAETVTTIRAVQGQELKVRLFNELEQDIWFHWFGVRGPSDMMTVNVQPGEQNAVDCVFTPPDAGTFWFGPLTSASQQREMGLYGLLVVAEKESPGDFTDLPIVLDDWLVDDAGALLPGFGNLEMAVAEGRLGNWFTVNGVLKPALAVEAAKPVRLRLLNAANVRTMGLLLKGADPWIMALDGQPVPLRHVGQDAVRLSPGQRVDLLLDKPSGTITLALDLFEDVVEIGTIQVSGKPGENALPDNFALPPNPISTQTTGMARAVTLMLEGGAKGGLKSARVGDETLDTRGLLERGLAWAINGVAGPGGPPLFTAKAGELLLLHFDNRTTFPQPLHIHGHVWQVAEADGAVKDGEPWRDTLVVPGLATLKAYVVADNPGVWAIQNLVAERVDAGFLGAFAVE
jgi:FtsP/CotA-like multicopper oxidase with cupredoxin domain